MQWSSEITTIKFPIGLEHKLEGLLQVATSFSEGTSLRVHTGNFFNVGDVPLSTLLDDGGELSFHGFSL
jgi:hypothetical protein